MAAGAKDANLFEPKQLVALELAEVMTRDAKKVSDDLWRRLLEHYDDVEVMELASVIGLFNYFNRFNDALQVDITR